MASAQPLLEMACEVLHVISHDGSYSDSQFIIEKLMSAGVPPEVVEHMADVEIDIETCQLKTPPLSYTRV